MVRKEGTFVAEDSIGAIMRGLLTAAVLVVPSGARGTEPAAAAKEAGNRGLVAGPVAGGLLTDKYLQRQEAVESLPLQRLTPEATRKVLDITNSPTIYRRLPVQAIECDRDMFLFLSRNPEVLVGIWQLMGITKVQMERVGPYQFQAEDGNGTECEIDLVYGDSNLHVFVAKGSYSGALVTAPVGGQGVFVLRSSYAESAGGGTTVTGVLDCFIQFDNLGADLVARTFSGLIGRSADQNFGETARFISQVSQMSERNPRAMVGLAERLPQVKPPTRNQFADTITTVARRIDARLSAAQQDEASQDR